MGTNYYHEGSKPCPHCGRADESRHIGKSSAGWCFSLHIYPEDGINSLDDWTERLMAGGAILNEYGDAVPVAEMLSVIRDREWCSSTVLLSGYAVPGPKGLLRHRIDDQHCIAHGPGTWDLCVGDFS